MNFPTPPTPTPARGDYTARRVLYNVLLHGALAMLWPLLLPFLAVLPRRRATLLSRLKPVAPLRPSGTGLRPIWIHALSVGEVVSAVPLVDALLGSDPRRPIVFSAATLTGLETARRLFAPRVRAVIPFPYDLHLPVRQALRAIDPALVLIVESDVWPEFLLALARRGIPALLVNARLSPRSLKRWRRLPFLARPVFGALRALAVQSPEDGERFRLLGVPAERIRVTGNLKFDMPSPARPDAAAAPLLNLLAARPEARILLAGSTHPGEESILLAAHAALRRRYPDLLMVIAPRHPQRAAGILRQARSAGFEAAALSALSPEREGKRAPGVIVIDRLGLLASLYALSTIALVGGSLIPIRGTGGHNPLEPAAWARPVLFGPHMDNFRTIVRLLLASGGAFEVGDADRLEALVTRLLDHPQAALRAGQAARAVYRANQGAVERTVSLVKEISGSPAP